MVTPPLHLILPGIAIGCLTMEGTFHRRKLPPPAIPFSSTEGKIIFQEALLSGGMQVYFPLAETFQTQGDPSFCGLGSLTTALNAILLDPHRVKVHCLARCQGAASTLHYANASTEDEFREAVQRSCQDESTSPTVIICSYSRSVMKQSGSGHFSPIGGYHAKKDLILIMDVARFKYAPHWVPLPLLFSAMNTIDSDDGVSRGWMTVQASQELNRRFSHGCCAAKHKADVGSNAEVDDNTVQIGDIDLESN